MAERDLGAARLHVDEIVGEIESRGFRALKIWMSLKAHGARKFGRLVEQNAEQARHLARRVEGSSQLELLAPVTLNVVCFRYAAPGFDPDALDRLNETILVEIQERGIAVPSSTVVDGRFCLRVAITNHRTRRQDLDLLVSQVLSLGGAFVAKLRQGGSGRREADGGGAR